MFYACSFKSESTFYSFADGLSQSVRFPPQDGWNSGSGNEIHLLADLQLVSDFGSNAASSFIYDLYGFYPLIYI